MNFGFKEVTFDQFQFDVGCPEWVEDMPNVVRMLVFCLRLDYNVIQIGKTEI